MSGNLYRLPIMIVALVIGIIMVTAVILPLSSEYAEAKTFTNDGYYRMSEYDSGTIVIEFDHTSPKVITVDDEPVSMPGTAESPYGFTIVGGNDLIIRYFQYQQQNRYFVQVFNTGDNTVYGADTNSSQDMTITIGSSSIVCDNGSGTTRTVTITDDVYYMDPEGDLIMKKYNKTGFVLPDSEIIGLGITSFANNVDERFVITGTIEDGFTATYVPYEATLSDIEATYTEEPGYIDLLNFDKLTFTATYNTNDIDITYSQVLIPYEISADPDNPAAYKSLVMVIPLMAFVVLVVAAAAMIYYKKD